MNDDSGNRKDDMAMLRKLTGRDDQEMIMNNDDERDYDEEAYNARTLATGDGEAEDTAPGTRVVVFRVPVTIGARVSDETALAGMTRILARAWKRLVPMSELAGPVTVIPDASQVPVHCAYCGAEVEEQDTGLWETGGTTASARRYCTDAPDHLHTGEATLCDRCGGNLVAGEGDARYCGPCTNTPDPDEDEQDMPRLAALLGTPARWEQDEDPPSRTGHRATATRLAGMAERSDPEFAPGLGFAALTHAVLALSAPAVPEPGEITVTAADLAAVLPRIRHQLTLTPDERARVSRLEQAVAEAGPA